MGVYFTPEFESSDNHKKDAMQSYKKKIHTPKEEDQVQISSLNSQHFMEAPPPPPAF